MRRLYPALGDSGPRGHTGPMSLVAHLAALASLASQTPGPAAPHEPPADPRCRLFGAIVDEAGAPVAGVTLSVNGSRASSVGVQRFGVPPGWKDPAPVTTGADGKFSVSFVPPRTFQFK